MTKLSYNIPITKPDLGDAEIDAVSAVLRSGWIMQGPKVTEFEQAFAEYVGAPAAIAVSSGTTALHLALYCAQIGSQDSVLCPSYSFIASANSIRYCGAEPIFVDIDPQTYNINPLLLSDACKESTRAIMVVHQVGMPAAMAEIRKFAEERGLIIIEDAACAVGSEYQGVKIGQPHSLAACFSFHPRKLLTTGDGGMITTANLELAARARSLRQHGGLPSQGYTEVGFNFRLTDVQAAIGHEQLKKLPQLIANRRVKAIRYNTVFQENPWLSPPPELPGLITNYQSYQLRLSPEAPISRDNLIAHLNAAGIMAQPGIVPIHKQLAYRDYAHISLPETERATREVIMLPIYARLSDLEQDYIIDTLLTKLSAS